MLPKETLAELRNHPLLKALPFKVWGNTATKYAQSTQDGLLYGSG